MAGTIEVNEGALGDDPKGARGPGGGVLGRVWKGAVEGIGPVVLALIAGGLLLLVLGRDPISFYGHIVRAGLVNKSGLQDTVIRMAPLLLMAGGLIVAFQGGIWNIGGDGQFLMGAALAAGFGPAFMAAMPVWSSLFLLCVIGTIAGGLLTIIPAVLKARYGVNEIISSLMMSFIGINLANLLIKGPFRSTKTLVPQTDVVPFAKLLPPIPGTRIHVGIVVALILIFLVYDVMKRTSLGLKLRLLGANPRAARHAGLNNSRLIVGAFMVSGAFMGLAGSVEILGVWGYMRADWNPNFGLALFALVFLARLNALATIPLVGFYAAFSIGGHSAARAAGLPDDFMLIIIGLVLLFMALSEYLKERRSGSSGLLLRVLRSLRELRTDE
ncbi:MAG: ABC transporter permease [Deltaproteobacteria bacterium]|nr:ABC transporter permease [Deltaproteobacteria bacterium]MBW2120609.1 ABC transporter permease [Deltaproteobacteria bacterium]